MGVSPHVTTITLGRWSPKRLDATYPPTPGAPSTLAYLVLLRVEIARFTFGLVPQLALRPSPKLVSVALILTLGPCTCVHSLSVDSR
jgi:hypothetical protein